MHLYLIILNNIMHNNNERILYILINYFRLINFNIKLIILNIICDEKLFYITVWKNEKNKEFNIVIAIKVLVKIQIGNMFPIFEGEGGIRHNVTYFFTKKCTKKGGGCSRYF